MSFEEREEKPATLAQESVANEGVANVERTEADERQAIDVEEGLELESVGESDSKNESDSSSNKKLKGDNVNVDVEIDELDRSSQSNVAIASDGAKASRSSRNNKRKTWSRKRASSQEEDRDGMNASWDDSDSHSDDEPELLESTGDSDSDHEHTSCEPRTLEKLGITLNRSGRIWRSHKSLRSREIGDAISPCLFTRNVAGSINMIQKLRLERKLEYHAGCVNTLNFNTTGDLLASGSDDLNVALWDWARGKKKFHYESGHTGNVFQVCNYSKGLIDIH